MVAVRSYPEVPAYKSSVLRLLPTSLTIISPARERERVRMAQETFLPGEEPLRRHQRPSSAAFLWASLASVALGGPLLGMMGFTLMASLTLLLVASPLLLFFSPLLFSAGFLLAASTVSFAAAAAMALAGASAFAWLISAVRGGGAGGAAALALTESGRQVKTQLGDFGGHLPQHKVQVFPVEHKIGRG